MQEFDSRTAVQAAEMLIDEHARGAPFHLFADRFGLRDPAAAYAVQDEYVRILKTRRNAGVAGYKIGLTSARMQAMCHIDSPLAGVVLDDSVLGSGARIGRSGYGRLGIEFEIAVRMARDLGAPATIAEVSDAVDAVCPAIEIVDDRGCDYRDLEALSLIADNSWNAGVVLGVFQRPWPDLAEIEGVVSLEGAETDRGHGRDVLGHPFQSVAWLASHLAGAGRSLRAGDIVMTGSIVTTKFPDRPCRYRFALDGLGSVEVFVD